VRDADVVAALQWQNPALVSKISRGILVTAGVKFEMEIGNRKSRDLSGPVNKYSKHPIQGSHRIASHQDPASVLVLHFSDLKIQCGFSTLTCRRQHRLYETLSAVLPATAP
jgi:hypothetical protein